MERIRKPFQGVINIIRFNWHFYVIAAGAIIALIIAGFCFPAIVQQSTVILCVLIVLSTVISLVASYYVYDGSGFYRFAWLKEVVSGNERSVVNIHAGFDETSEILRYKFPQASLQVLDFYDATKHTELSIRRARKTVAPYPGTQSVTTDHLPLAEASADIIFLVFAAHEIRNDEERINFFRLLNAKLTAGGQIILVEHLRDLPNLLAYNIGFLHFIPIRKWLRSFECAGLRVSKRKKLNPFVTLFVLVKR